MTRYLVKCINGKHYVIDMRNEEKIVSSGYYNRDNAEIVCDKKNLTNDLGGLMNMRL